MIFNYIFDLLFLMTIDFLFGKNSDFFTVCKVRFYSLNNSLISRCRNDRRCFPTPHPMSLRRLCCPDDKGRDADPER